MASHINQVILEGHLLTNPTTEPDGTVTVTLQNHEEWKDRDAQPQARENMLGIIALPGQMARDLLSFRAKEHVIIVGKLETRAIPGPKGGTATKTKIRLCKISRPA